MATSETEICNLALGLIGSPRINALTDETVSAIKCRLHYPQVRDALLRSHWWRFATARKTLSQDTTDPDFQWDNQFDLPTDFLRMKALYNTNYSYDLEGKKLLTDDDTAEIVYIRKVTDVAQFDPLFVDILSLQLAVILAEAIAQDRLLMRELEAKLVPYMAQVRTIDRQETNTKGRADQDRWVDRKFGLGRIDSKLGGA